MDYMDPDVRCPKKAVKLHHSLNSIRYERIIHIGIFTVWMSWLECMVTFFNEDSTYMASLYWIMLMD